MYTRAILAAPVLNFTFILGTFLLELREWEANEITALYRFSWSMVGLYFSSIIAAFLMLPLRVDENLSHVSEHTVHCPR